MVCFVSHTSGFYLRKGRRLAMNRIFGKLFTEIVVPLLIEAGKAIARRLASRSQK
jgi:hypothetical protein